MLMIALICAQQHMAKGPTLYVVTSSTALVGLYVVCSFVCPSVGLMEQLWIEFRRFAPHLNVLLYHQSYGSQFSEFASKLSEIGANDLRKYDVIVRRSYSAQYAVVPNYNCSPRSYLTARSNVNMLSNSIPSRRRKWDSKRIHGSYSRFLGTGSY